MIDAVPPGSPTVGCHILGFARYVQRLQICAKKAGNERWRHPVHHHVVGEIGKRVPKRRQLPIENCYNPGFRGMENQIVHSKIAMYQRSFIACRDMRREPFNQSIQVRIAAGVRIGQVLLGPAPNLTFKVVARLAEIREPDLPEINGVKVSDYSVHGVEISRTLSALDLWKRRIPDVSTRHAVHHIEPGADNLIISAQPIDMRHRKARWLKCPQHSRLTVYGVSTYKCGSRRLATHYISLGRRHELVGRIGLATLELLDRQRAAKLRYVLSQPRRQAFPIKAER